MKYSNGFFIYKATPLHTPAENELTFTSEMWILKKKYNILNTMISHG